MKKLVDLLNCDLCTDELSPPEAIPDRCWWLNLNVDGAKDDHP